MGYYVDLIETNAYIPHDKQEYAYELVCEINNHHANKVGRRDMHDTPSPHEGEWFSWMAWNYPDKYDNVRDVLQEVGFDLHTDADNGLWFVGYSNKMGCEEYFLQALENVLEGASGQPARFVWVGEDHEMWAQEMHVSHTGDRELVTKQAHITWE